MNTIYKFMGILLVFTNANYAVDAIVYMASKGGVPYSHIREIRTLQTQQLNSNPLSVTMLEESSGIVSAAVADTPLEEDLGVEGGAEAFPLLPIVVERFKDLDEEFGVLGEEVQEQGVTDDGEASDRALSPLSFSMTGSRLARAPSFTDDDFFASAHFQRVEAPPQSEGGSALAVEPVSEFHRRTPREVATVTFTRKNTKVTVSWGGRFEGYRAVGRVLTTDPGRYQPPLTPINQVVRLSVLQPGSRPLESRLREAKIGALFPIQLVFNPKTWEEVIKVAPPPKVSAVEQVET